MPDRPPPAQPLALKLKICGLRDPDQAATIAAMGVDAIGVVAVPGSPRFLPVEQRSALFTAVRDRHPGCLGVLVVADPVAFDLPALHPSRGHQVVQLHGSETPAQCGDLRRALGPEVLLWKALRIRSERDLLLGERYAGVVDALLLDAWVPDQLGGTGRTIPLQLIERFQPTLPWWLAGGIRPETVGSILEQVRPHGLDASSGVEECPGWKNLERVRELLKSLEVHRSPSPDSQICTEH